MARITSTRSLLLTVSAALPSLLGGCAFDSELADRAAVDIVIDSGAVVTTETDLGYRVELSRCRVAIDTVELTTDGEQHASLLGSAWDLLVPSAYAHPGHYGGGEVVGELTGRHVFDWRDDGGVLGQATLLEAEYTGANFSFTRAGPDEVAPDDPLLGHTFEIVGTATLDDERWQFSALLDQDDGRRVVGLPLSFELDPDSDDQALAIQLLVQDPFEEDSLFDGIDFAMLDEDGDHVVVIEPGTEAYNRLRRSTQAHDHYAVAPL